MYWLYNGRRVVEFRTVEEDVEGTMAYLAKTYPEAIYFEAELVMS